MVRFCLAAAILALHAQAYEIELNVQGFMETFTRSVFDQAAIKWQTVIDGNLETVTGMTGSDDLCGDYPETINDLYICGRWIPIDFFGGVLGFAGPTVFRQGSNLPAAGMMAFDKFDSITLLAQGNMAGVIVHEMGHIIGVGTLWEKQGLVGAGDCPYNQESNASKYFREISGCTGAIPTENDGGQGTKCGHWDEECLQHELMTGFASGNLALSKITVGTLEDIGYNVKYDAADSYSESDLGAVCQCRRRNLKEPEQANTKEAEQENTEENPRTRMLRMRDEAKKSESERELSPAALAAVQFGKQHLQEMASVNQAARVSGGSAWDTQVYYVGDLFVSVFYSEGSILKTIDVWAD